MKRDFRKSKRRRSSSKAMTSSFAAGPTASRAQIQFRGRPEVPANCRAFLLGVLGVCFLVLLGGAQHSLALGLALVLPGAACLLRPPTRSLGKWMDFGILGLLVTLLFAFIPLFYWKTPAWRQVAVESLGVELPAVLSVQPLISFEGWLLAAAGFCWLYVASSWGINHTGRKRVLFWISCMIGLSSLVVIAGNTFGWRYPGAGSATAFSFFPDSDQTSHFIAIGGVVAFGYGVEGLRVRKLMHLVGLLAAALALFALVHSVSRTGVFLFLGGVLLWYLFSLRRAEVSRIFKLGLPAVVLIFGYCIQSNEYAVERVTELFAAPAAGLGVESRTLILRDTVDMVRDTPLAGVGVGNFAAVFPQYRNASRGDQPVEHPGSDLMWLTAEGGLVALGFLGVVLFAYFSRCRSAIFGRSGAYRTVALTAVILFLLHSCVAVSGHRPGTAYFAIVCAALALPSTSGARSVFKPWIWRTTGAGLLLCGVLWMAAGLFGWSTHSRTVLALVETRADESRSSGDLERAQQAADELIDWQPLNWRGYVQRAQVNLSDRSARAEVVQDFERARFVEPNLGITTYQEGELWLPYDVSRTISAWRETLNRDIADKNGVYDSMLRAAQHNVALMERMLELSKLDSNYRSRLILSLEGNAFTRELQHELELDPSLAQFTAAQRTALVEGWINQRGVAAAEAYLQRYEATLNAPWKLWSLVRHKQARFKEAIDFIRNALPVVELPEVVLEQRSLAHLRRGFFASPSNISKGLALLRLYLDAGELQKALLVVDALLGNTEPTIAAYYWRAEVLYQLGDYIESLDAFEAYLTRIDASPQFDEGNQ